MKYQIRLIRENEAAQAAIVMRTAFRPYVRSLGREQPADAYDWLPAAIENGRGYGAFDQDVLTGLITTERDDKGWELDQIAVDPPRQRLGIGSALILHVVKVARENDVPSLFLYTAALHTDLLTLYERHGFQEIRRGPPDHGADDFERVFMEKRL